MDNNFKKLDGLHKSYQSINDRFIILFKLYKEASKKKQTVDSLILRVYNGSSLWQLDVTNAVIDQLRQRSGVEGSFSTLCEMIHHAITAQEFSIQIDGLTLQINLQFLLGRGVYVKGWLNLGDAVPVVNDEDYKLLNRLFVFDLYDALQLRVQELPSSVALIQKDERQDVSLLTMKSKPKSDMVRPTMRKRRGLGAKLV